MLYSLVKNTRTLSVIGMCKNAGKTTVLNALIKRFNIAGKILGLTSIGRDGEKSDIVTNTKKPEIAVISGTIIATAEKLLAECGISREILCTTAIYTPLGEIVLLRAMEDGYVQLAGPSITEQAIIVRDLLYSYEVDNVLIDGAISRKSLAMPRLSDSAILCSGASYNTDMAVTVRDTVYIAELFSLPIYRYHRAVTSKYTVIANDDAFSADTILPLMPHIKNGCSAIILSGGLTDSVANELASALRHSDDMLIVAEDASRILFSHAMYTRLLRMGAHMNVLRKTALVAIAVNAFSAYGNHYDRVAFKQALTNAVNERGITTPIIDIKEQGLV